MLPDNYPFLVHPQEEGGFVVTFPDLPGCLTQTERFEDVLAMAQEVKALWLETERARGNEVPPCP